MLSRFFIHRPIFASVISIAILIAGGVSLLALPVAQFPDISPPTVTVSTSYPGANAVVVAETVATPIEQEVNGVENIDLHVERLRQRRQLLADGHVRTGHRTSTSPPVQVQNRVQSAMPKLPEEVKRLGVNTKKKSPDFALMVSLVSPDGRYDALYLNNYAVLRLKDELARTPGVGDISIFGASEYSMRIWLDPNKLQARNLTTNDVVNAIREQNVQVAAGAIGDPRRARGRAVPVHRQDARPPRRREAVPRHHRQDRRGRPHHAREGRRARQARGRELQDVLAAQREAGGDDHALPAARLQRPRHLEGCEGEDGGSLPELPGGPRVTSSPTTPPRSSSLRSTRSPRRCSSRRSSSS